ncbi:MAG: zinc ribbon domain-containing protein [Candidatus Marsarchaeota archaeon]|nr:zinc ribbon domain-containing protein [Candidatus Marsarchaeota archaeon]
MHPTLEGIEVTVCTKCKRKQFPARKVCQACGSREFILERAYLGTVIARTTVEAPPSGFSKHRLVYVKIGDVYVIASTNGDLPVGSKVKLFTSTERPVIRAVAVDD